MRYALTHRVVAIRLFRVDIPRAAQDADVFPGGKLGHPDTREWGEGTRPADRKTAWTETTSPERVKLSFYELKALETRD